MNSKARIVFGFALSLGVLGASAGAELSSPLGPYPIPTVLKLTGEVLKVDTESVLVKEESGKEVRLQIDAKTQTTLTPQVGDKIEAEFIPTTGHTLVIKEVIN